MLMKAPTKTVDTIYFRLILVFEGAVLIGYEF